MLHTILKDAVVGVAYPVVARWYFVLFVRTPVAYDCTVTPGNLHERVRQHSTPSSASCRRTGSGPSRAPLGLEAAAFGSRLHH
jgi:hypothetical protein